MRKITFTNANKERIVLQSTGPYFLTKLEGVAAVRTTVQLNKSPFQDGQTYLGNTLDVREITIEGSIVPGAVTLEERRRTLMRVLNPKLGLGIVRYEDAGGAKEIRAIAEESPVFPDKQHGVYQKFLISFLCPDPAFYDPRIQKVNLASFTGGISFPFSFPISFGRVGQFITLNNRGDLDAPVLITFLGPLKNPVLENKTTGQMIKLVQEIPEGHRLEINTAFGQKTVTKIAEDGTRSNAFHWVAPESEFWGLVPGENEISYQATEESKFGAVTLEYQPRYLGV
ncbi:phage tail family protein [Paenibacillus caseinilyticus]|uniref:Tail protein n=1 Tax=Paenibacillus mucilaginosus K02 TaxID=997761 RepID=I0BE18_9BACL|nr:phage tail family protein [Paenibacillus mucilaginosus]AFH60615.1 tail protein [Paenibacillus mucilaginosus K02]